MELRHLRYFLAVAEERNFMRAAERLHISQPPLSTQIRDLEQELGVRLFDRTNKGVQMTVAGDAFYLEARAVLARVEHAKIVAARAGSGEIGRLDIGFVSLVDYSLLPPTMRAFSTSFPAVAVELREETTDVQIENLLEDRLDIGFALGPVDRADIRFEPLVSERLVVAIPTSHALSALRGPVSLSTLADDGFIMFPRRLAPGLYDSVMATAHAAGFAPRVIQLAKQMQTIVGLVSSGLGVALVPESIRHLQRTGVVYCEIADSSPTVQIGLAYRTAEGNPAIANFIQVARTVASAIAAEHSAVA